MFRVGIIFYLHYSIYHFKLPSPMIKHLEHIGIAVKDLEKANALYEQLLGVTPYKEEAVASEQVRTSFFLQDKGAKIELLEPSGEDSAIAKFIEKRGEGIHHMPLR